MVCVILDERPFTRGRQVPPMSPPRTGPLTQPHPPLLTGRHGDPPSGTSPRPRRKSPRGGSFFALTRHFAVVNANTRDPLATPNGQENATSDYAEGRVVTLFPTVERRRYIYLRL